MYILPCHTRYKVAYSTVLTRPSCVAVYGMTTAKFLIDRDGSVIHHECFYNLINACAERHGIVGRVIFNRHGYVLTIAGPEAAVQEFTEFMRYLNGSVGTVQVIQRDRAAVMQASGEDDTTEEDEPPVDAEAAADPLIEP